MVFLWFVYGFPMVFLWCVYGFPMVFLWFSFDLSMVFLWFSYDVSMVFLWFSYGFPMVLPMLYPWCLLVKFRSVAGRCEWPWPAWRLCWRLPQNVATRADVETIFGDPENGENCLVYSGKSIYKGIIYVYVHIHVYIYIYICISNLGKLWRLHCDLTRIKVEGITPK